WYLKTPFTRRHFAKGAALTPSRRSSATRQNTRSSQSPHPAAMTLGISSQFSVPYSRRYTTPDSYSFGYFRSLRWSSSIAHIASMSSNSDRSDRTRSASSPLRANNSATTTIGGMAIANRLLSSEALGS